MRQKKYTQVLYGGLLVLCVGGQALEVSAEIYKWRDEKGKLHVSDKPPPDVNAETVELGPTNISDSVKVAPRPVKPTKEQRSSPKENAEKAKAEQLKQMCDKLRAEYIDLKWGKSATAAHTVLTRDDKPISRREQNEIAERFRADANSRGCDIEEKPW